MRKRVDFIDVYRAIGICLMIMGHVGFGNLFYKFIHAFNMPMFFFVTGFFYKPFLSVYYWLWKKFKKTIIPYLTISLVFCIVGYFFSLGKDFITNLRFFLIVDTNMMIIGAAIWFLPSLLIAEFIYQFIDRYIKSNFLRCLCIFLFIGFGHTLSLLKINLYFCVVPAFIGLGFISIGHLLGLHYDFILEKYKGISKVYKTIGLMVLSMVNLISIFCNSEVNMRTNNYGIIPLFWTSAVISIFLLLIFSYYLNSYFKKKKGLVKKIFLSVLEIGKYSITFLGFNQLIIYFVSPLISDHNLSKLLTRLCVFFISILMLYILNKIILKTKLRIFFGI